MFKRRGSSCEGGAGCHTDGLDKFIVDTVCLNVCNMNDCGMIENNWNMCNMDDCGINERA